MTKRYKKATFCRACNSEKLFDVMNFGEINVSTFLKKEDLDLCEKAPLILCLCESCSLLQLRHTVNPDLMYRNYWYMSGINQTMTLELTDITQNSRERVNLNANDFVIDIGANDGTLLRAYSKPDLFTIGFEPAKNLLKIASVGTSKIINDYFSAKIWEENFPGKKASIITAIGMFYDLDSPNNFIEDVNFCLAKDGIFVIQMMYLPFFLKKNAFDGVCHEHLEYYSFKSLENLLSRHNLKIFDIQIRESVNEGSLRFFICKTANINIKTNKVVDIIKSSEADLDLNNKLTYLDLFKRISKNKLQTLDFISNALSEGKIIHGLAASTKGNTTLQFYQLTSNEIHAISDRNPRKWGLFTTGSAIPIISEDESRKLKPDYYFVLAWHFLDEIRLREKEFLDNGGKFILSMPEFRVLGSHDF